MIVPQAHRFHERDHRRQHDGQPERMHSSHDDLGESVSLRDDHLVQSETTIASLVRSVKTFDDLGLYQSPRSWPLWNARPSVVSTPALFTTSALQNNILPSFSSVVCVAHAMRTSPAIRKKKHHPIVKSMSFRRS